ncbi:MAG: tetratricopeptide repeat protein [Pyrinomonadaceae bacterium]
MKIILITLIMVTMLGCGGAAPVQNAMKAPVAPNTERPQTAIAHSSENQTPHPSPPTGEKSKWTQSGDPIDTKQFDTAIAAAEVALVKKSSDEKAKKALSTAYFNRAMALTDARQYASALGDFRRAVKYDPSNTEAKDWIQQIISIYSSINRESPNEGEEPPPLPFTKGK